MKNTIETGDGEHCRQETQGPCDAWICPPADIGSQCFENELVGAPLRQCRQGRDGGDEEQHVQDPPNGLEGVQYFPKEKITEHREDDERPHKHGRMPSLRFVCLVVEDDQSLDHVGQD